MVFTKRITASPDVLWIVCSRSSIGGGRSSHRILKDRKSGVAERVSTLESDSPRCFQLDHFPGD